MTAPMSPPEHIRPIRVILADDDPNLRDALASLLGMDPRISIVGTAADGREVLALVEHRPADIVLMDVEMPVLDGVETTRIMSERHSSVRVVMFTAFEVQHRLSEALAAGACSFLRRTYPWLRSWILSSIFIRGTAYSRPGRWILRSTRCDHLENNRSAPKAGLAPLIRSPSDNGPYMNGSSRARQIGRLQS